MNKLLIIISGLSLIISSCGTREAPPDKEEASETQSDSVAVSRDELALSGIELGHVELRALSGSVQVTGMLDVPPQNLVNITAPLGGFLRSTPLLQGMHVSKGQVIAVIENPEYIQLQQDYLDTRSQVEYLEAEYERQKHLSEESVNAQKTLQKSLADMTSMKARNSGLLAKLKVLGINPEKLKPESIHSTIELRATMPGYVTQIHSSIGAFVSPTDVMFTIVDTEHLHAELICFERDIQKIKKGQKITFTLAHETTERTATVFLIGREISADRTVRIHGHLDKEDRDLIPGMYLKASIQTGTEKVPCLPEVAVLNFENSQVIVAQKKDGFFHLIEVTTGIRENGFVEVILPEGFDRSNTLVAMKNAYKVLSKMKNIEEEE